MQALQIPCCHFWTIEEMKHRFPLHKETYQVIAYFFGVTGLWLTAFLLGRYPQYFPQFYIVVISILIGTRFYLYKQMNYHYFLIDFCYVLNGLLVFHIVFPTDLSFTVVFCLAHGPVAWAIAMWRNALVFHSLDKITSVCIHILPCITIFAMTWMDDTHQHRLNSSYFTISFLVYGVWQTCYFFFIEHKAEKVETGERITSYTYMKNYYNVEVSFKNFIFIQAIYTILTLIPTILFYNSKILHACFIVFLVNVATFNGASREMYRHKKHKESKKTE